MEKSTSNLLKIFNARIERTDTDTQSLVDLVGIDIRGSLYTLYGPNGERLSTWIPKLPLEISSPEEDKIEHDLAVRYLHFIGLFNIKSINDLKRTKAHKKVPLFD